MIEIKGSELIRIFKDIIDIRNVYCDKQSNFIQIKGMVHVYIFRLKISILAKFWIQEINISSYVYKDEIIKAIFINFMSKNVFFEYVFKILYKRYREYQLDFGVKQEKNKYGSRYGLAIRGPQGIEYLSKKYPNLSEFFQLNSCKSIEWKFKEDKIIILIEKSPAK